MSQNYIIQRLKPSINNPKTQTQFIAQTFCTIPRVHPMTNSQRGEQKEREIPRRHKPVLQWQGHRASKLQAELEGQGRQKLDNQ